MMSADANDAVLVCKRTGHMLPFYKGAFQSAEGWPAKIRSEYRGAFLIDEDGNAEEIEDVKIARPLGKSKLSMTFSFLNGNWSVELVSRARNKSLQEVKELILQGLRKDQDVRFAFFPSVEGREYSTEILQLSSTKDIFNYLGLSREILIAKEEEEHPPILDGL